VKPFLLADACNTDFEDLAKWYPSVHFLSEIHEQRMTSSTDDIYAEPDKT
jgi:hypothetical protein